MAPNASLAAGALGLFGQPTNWPLPSQTSRMVHMLGKQPAFDTVGADRPTLQGHMLHLMRIYKAASQPVRWQFWFTLGLIIANVVQRATAQTTSTLGQELVTRDNFMLAVATVFAAGIVWTQFKDISKRLGEQEAASKQLRDVHLPETYVRRDVLEAQMERISELLAGRQDGRQDVRPHR